MTRPAIVVMGVSGAGKTTIGRRVAAAMRLDFVDGDDLHSAANVAKMKAGVPLGDAERGPWLDRVAGVLADASAHPVGVVVACSALRRAYRDRLRRGAPGCRFLYLALDRQTAERRVEARHGHYMPVALVADQFATLEPPAADETDAITLASNMPPDELIGFAIDRLAPFSE